jgi:hypothetical protein
MRSFLCQKWQTRRHPWREAWAGGLSKAAVHQGSREPEVALFMIAGHGYVLITLACATGVGGRRRRRNLQEMNVLPRPFSERRAHREDQISNSKTMSSIIDRT